MSPAATEPSSLERHLSNAEETQLAEALELRRRQIDREIAEFKVDKDREFRKFEKRLRSEKRDTERLKILQCEREVEKANQKRRGSRDSLAVYSAGDSNTTGNAADEDDGTRSNGVRFSSAVEIHADEKTRREKKEAKKSASAGSSQDSQSTHEREVEFHGLFTPTYLPLLSGKPTDQREGPLDQTSARPDEASPAPEQNSSSGATTVHPHQPPSGDPRKMSMSECRSPSRSDTSVSSLRSSIRDRKQHRSPKRVLFSIDNIVVSPSTSPVMQRKANASKKTGSNDRSVVVPSYSDAPKDETTPDRSTLPGKAALTNVPTSSVQENGGGRLARPGAQMASSSPSMGGDGFEHIRGGDDDDLFAFDEDVTYRVRATAADDLGDEIKEDELGNGLEALPTSSPHAGSLPIEIKWPGRRDPRG
ncbi:MAG: hypothetical protein Q9226_002898 [Calogaya cf. arnoldii]